MEEQELRRRRDRSGEAEAQEFEATHRRLSDRVERILMQVVILGLVGVVLVQALAVSPALRRKLNLLEGAEGYALTEDSSWWQMLTADSASEPPGKTPVQEVTPQAAVATASAAAKKYTLTVQLETRASAPKARLLIDGKAAADFRTGQATVLVEHGDSLIIDGSEYKEALTFRVVMNKGLIRPRLDQEVTTRGNQQLLGAVAGAAR